jgi:hypothetical protein
MMGRRGRNRNYSPQKNNSMSNSVGNEENGYPILDLNKTTINVTKKLRDAHKKTLKEKIWEIHGKDIRHDQPECIRCTQEILRHQKQRT